MANEISKVKLPNDTTEYPLQDDQAIASISRSGTTFTATRRDGTSFTFTQQDNNTTYTFATGDNNGQIKVTPSGGTAQNVSVKGLGAAAYKGTTTSVTSGSSDLVTSGAVYTAIDNLPEPMIFKGSLGTGGTITTLPTASSANEGFTYKVITAGTYASQVAKVGDLFISNGTDWIWIPSGDEPSGTVTSVAIANGGGLSVSGSPITSSGTITISHADTSSQASVDNSGRTYIQDITLDTYGHVTKITSATETVVNTDRYVNSAAFANDTSGVKMTLTRAGSDTATVTGTIPLVSSSTAGVAPKGTAVSSQSQSTKFLREDGTWAAPSYTTNTNTTYTLGTNGNAVTLTPSSGSIQNIAVPYATKAAQDDNGDTIKSTYLKLSGGTMTGVLAMGGKDIALKTTDSSSDNSADIVWYYGDGREKARLWTANEYTEKSGLNYRVYKKDGTGLYWGTIPTADGAGASGTWGISISGNAATASDSSKLNGYASDTAATNNTIVRRTANGYLFATYLNQSSGTETPTTDSYWMYCNSDGYLRKSSRANVASVLNGVISPYEEKLQWGGGNITGSVSPIGCSLSSEHNGNRLAFINGAALDIRYSSNGGSTYTDYGFSATNKSAFCTATYTIPVGRASGSTEYTTSCRTQVTITAQNGTNQYIYTRPRKMLVCVSTAAGMSVLIEYRTGTNYQSDGAWTTFGTYALSGCSGWNDIPLVLAQLGGSTSQTYQIWQLRLTFIITSVHSTNKTYANILGIRLFGDADWYIPSNLGKIGHMYTYDMSQNVFFPAQVTATQFNGALSGNATSATTASKATAANLTTTQYGIAYYTNSTGTFGNNPCLITTSTGGLEVKGMIAGDSGSTGHGLYGGGGYHNAYNNILLHGDATTGTSGIAFISDKITASTGAVTTINQPSDRAFIQYHACGITSATAEGTNPSLATTGENGRLVIGIGNDATDQLWLQTPSRTGLIHQVGATSYVIPDTNNTTGSVGSATNPVYVADGIIKACTYSLNKTVPSNAVFTDTNTTYTLSTEGNFIVLTPSSGAAYNVQVPYALSATYYSGGGRGSLTKPVYFKDNGAPAACSYSLEKSVPSNAVFTDTNTHRPIQVNGTEILGDNTTALNLKAGSNVSVTNSSGTVTIAATDTNTTYALSADTTNNKITLTPSSGTAQSITVPYATSAGGVAWGNVTGKPSSFTPSSHTHGIADITWAGNANLKANASANNQEWSIDLTPGSYTGTYWQVWSAKNSKTILACYTDTNDVKVPNGSFYVNGEVIVGSGIELGTASASSPSLIDFHWNTTMSGNDFTARIWQRGENTVDLIGKNSSTWGIWRAGSFSTQSSIHAKENIQDITVEDSRKLLQLRPVTFNYKNGGLTDQAGLIAEEVYLVMPKMVIGDINYNPEEPWNTPSIDYSKFVPYLIKMVQEQQKEIDELKEMINQ